MKYFDLHCDALTQEGVLHVTKENLRRGGCALQCFAAFVSAEHDRFRACLSLLDAFDALVRREGYVRVSRRADMGGISADMVCPQGGGNADMVAQEEPVRAMLTLENGGAAEGSMEKLGAILARGVRMVTLVWNYPNEMGYPVFPDYDGYRAGRVPLRAREGERGLTPFGFCAAEEMARRGVILDVSHGSDRLVADVARIASAAAVPFVASHSGADAVYSCARNLTDAGIRAVADSGGVVGLYSCAAFLSGESGAEGQREALLCHAAHILKTGGEDALAIGTDFDGTPPNPALGDPSQMPYFLERFADRFGSRVAEKFALGNASRVFSSCLKP